MRWEWIPNNVDRILADLGDHIVLTGIAVGVGFGLSLALSLFIYRWRALLSPITGIAGVLYTIPSLALLAFLVPFTGLSVLSAEIALVSYTLLILIRNIVAGLDSVPADVRESAAAMGYTTVGRLLRIELPLAQPLIVAGLRIATVTTIGLVMVTAVIGQGGLGQLILRGFGLRNFAAVYAGAVTTVLLAIVADLLLIGIGKLTAPWTRARRT